MLEEKSEVSKMFEIPDSKITDKTLDQKGELLNYDLLPKIKNNKMSFSPSEAIWTYPPSCCLLSIQALP